MPIMLRSGMPRLAALMHFSLADIYFAFSFSLPDSGRPSHDSRMMRLLYFPIVAERSMRPIAIRHAAALILMKRLRALARLATKLSCAF